MRRSFIYPPTHAENLEFDPNTGTQGNLGQSELNIRIAADKDIEQLCQILRQRWNIDSLAYYIHPVDRKGEDHLKRQIESIILNDMSDESMVVIVAESKRPEENKVKPA